MAVKVKTFLMNACPTADFREEEQRGGGGATRRRGRRRGGEEAPAAPLQALTRLPRPQPASSSSSSAAASSLQYGKGPLAAGGGEEGTQSPNMRLAPASFAAPGRISPPQPFGPFSSAKVPNDMLQSLFSIYLYPWTSSCSFVVSMEVCKHRGTCFFGHFPPGRTMGAQ